jgi:predicted PurR-regulated permease PerM
VPIGAGIVAIPLGIIELITGNVGGGIFILLAFILVINNIDNILRPRLVGKDAHLHPALTLVGILGGLELFGFFGILVGPIVLILLVTSLEVYIKYYSNDDSVVS